MDEIETVIERIVRQEIGEVEEVRVVEDYDDEDDLFYRVTVVYKQQPDVEKMKGLVRHLRSALTRGREFTFPLVSYRSVKDDRRLTPAAA